MNSDYVYTAGIVDGEGTIGLAKNNGDSVYKSPYISVSSTTVELINWLHSKYGGTVCRHKPRKANHSPAFSWRLRTKAKVFELLRQVLPYLKVPDKIKRTTMLLNEYDKHTKRNGKYTAKEQRDKLQFERRFHHPSGPSRARKAPMSL